MAPPIPIVVFLLVLSAVSSSSLPPDPEEDGIRVVFAQKVIHLTGPIARVTLTLEVENAATAASHASRVLLAFTPRDVEHLAIVKATRVEGRHSKKSYEPLCVQASDLPKTKNGAHLYSVLLSTHLKPGEATTLEVLYVLTDVLDPYPAKAVSPSSATQLVYFQDTAVLISPYHVLEQVTYINMPSNRLDTYTVVDPTSRAGAEMKYGTYYNQMPVTFLPITFHYENRPFVVFEKLERKVDVPRWGHIKVTDQYKMRHDDAWYKRIFSRPECPRNWPTSHTLLSSNKDWLYRNLNRGPRYGWHCTFTIDYGLPLEDFLFQSEDGRRYINLTFGVPLLDTVVNDFTIMVVLPEGSKKSTAYCSFSDGAVLFVDHDLEQAKNTKLLLSVVEQLFGIKINFHKSEAIPMRTYWQRFWALLQHDNTKARLAGRALEMQTSSSYFAGRAMVVLKKEKLVAEHNVPFQVYYESNPIFMLTDRPLTLLSAVLLVIVAYLYFT